MRCCWGELIKSGWRDTQDLAQVILMPIHDELGPAGLLDDAGDHAVRNAVTAIQQAHRLSNQTARQVIRDRVVKASLGRAPLRRRFEEIVAHTLGLT